MADIPVERRGGMPGWVWLLLALLLVVLLFLLLGRGCGDDVDTGELLTDTTTMAMPPVVEPGDDATLTDLDFDGPADIEDVNLLFDRAREGSVVGQTVRFDDVTVTNVVGDSTFYVSNGSENAFVVLEGLGEAGSGVGAADGRYAIRDGETLDIAGRVASMDEGMRGRYSVRGDAAPDYYIRARRVDT